MSWWCHPTISSSVVPFSSCPPYFPASGSFPMSQLFASSGQSTGASALVLPMNIQDWFHSGLTGWISLLSKGLSRIFSNTTVQKNQFFGTHPPHGPALTPIHDYWKNHSFSGGLVAKSCPTLVTLWTVASQAPLSMGFSKQEHWSGLPFPSPGDLPDPGIEPRSPALQADSLP